MPARGPARAAQKLNQAGEQQRDGLVGGSPVVPNGSSRPAAADHLQGPVLPEVSSYSAATASRRSVMQRRVAELLNPWGSSEIHYVKNHRLVCKHKVYLNVYHLLSPATNRRMMCLRIGGAFHSAIELKGREYAFGGHDDEFKGIYDCVPLHKQREEEEEKINKLNLKNKKERKAMEKKALAMLPPLKDRKVIGIWSGTTLEWERLLDHLHTKGNWRGPGYRLLSRNCNNFVGEFFQLLLDSQSFGKAPGVSEKDLDYLFHLPHSTWRLCCGFPSIPEALDEPLPPAPQSVDVFRGKPRRLNEGQCQMLSPLRTGAAILSATQQAEDLGSPKPYKSHSLAAELTDLERYPSGFDSSAAEPSIGANKDYYSSGMDDEALDEAGVLLAERVDELLPSQTESGEVSGNWEAVPPTSLDGAPLAEGPLVESQWCEISAASNEAHGHAEVEPEALPRLEGS